MKNDTELQKDIVDKALAVGTDVRLSAFDVRTDADIAQSAANVLRWASGVPDAGIQVLVESGWITLSGQVDWQDERQAAWDAIRHLVGVTGVSDQMTVRPPVLAVKSAIEASLKRRTLVDATAILVQVDGADVTLTGSVQSFMERERASDSAWSTPGVRNVINEITLTC